MAIDQTDRRQYRESRGTFPPSAVSSMVHAHQLTIQQQERELARASARIAELEALVEQLQPTEVTSMMSNEDRADWGKRAIENGTPDYRSNHASGDEDTNVVDALANILHYCAQQGISYLACANTAERHYEAEVAEALRPRERRPGGRRLMWVATMESEHFSWMAVSRSEKAALEALADGWDRQMRAGGFEVTEVETDVDNIHQTLANYVDVRPDGDDVTFCGRQALLYYDARATSIPTGRATCDGRVI